MNMQTTLLPLSSSKGLFAIAFLFAALVLIGCDNKGPAEKTGERIDKTTEEAGDRMGNATDSLRGN